MTAWHDVRVAAPRAMLRRAVSVFTWRTMAQDAGLDRFVGVEVMARAVERAEPP